MGKDFFDDFDDDSKKILLSPACISQLNALLVDLGSEGAAPADGQARYVALLAQLLGAQGADIQAAQRDNPGFAYLDAATDLATFESLMAQTVAAAAAADKSAAEAARARAAGVESVAGTWEPPPPDAVPETFEAE